jgi:hypothetical protein
LPGKAERLQAIRTGTDEAWQDADAGRLTPTTLYVCRFFEIEACRDERCP